MVLRTQIKYKSATSYENVFPITQNTIDWELFSVKETKTFTSTKCPIVVFSSKLSSRSPDTGEVMTLSMGKTSSQPFKWVKAYSSNSAAGIEFTYISPYSFSIWADANNQFLLIIGTISHADWSNFYS